MGSIIIALPKIADSKHIADILRRYGTETALICTAGSTVLSKAHELEGGLVICSERLKDMHCTELMDYLPAGFDVLLLVPESAAGMCPRDVMTLTFPLRAADLVGTVEMMLSQQRRRRKRTPGIPKSRTWQEQNYINNAKMVLMERNNMSESEAFRYIQKSSMDSGTNMVETAQMILLMICET